MPRDFHRSPSLNSPAATPSTDDAPPRVDQPGAGGPVVASGHWTSIGFSSARDWQALTDSLARTGAEQPWDLRGIAQLDLVVFDKQINRLRRLAFKNDHVPTGKLHFSAEKSAGI